MDLKKFEPPRTIAEARAILRHLTLPELTEDRLKAISAHEGERFRKALADLANRVEDNYEEARNYVVCVISAVSPATENAIKHNLGFVNVPLSTLIDLSKAEGTIFRTAIKSVINNPADSKTEIAYLRRLLQQVVTDVDPQPPQAPPTTPRAEPINLAERRERAAPLPRPPGRPRADQAAPQSDRSYVTHHLYAGKGALCFSLDVTRSGQNPTVRLEGAASVGERKYNWQDKIGVQLTLAELVLIYGVFYGYLPRLELNGHGANNEKGLTIQDQESKYFISLYTKGRSPIAVPAPPKDVYAVMGMIWDQIKANSPTQSDAVILNHIKRTCEKHALSNREQPPARRAAG